MEKPTAVCSTCLRASYARPDQIDGAFVVRCPAGCGGVVVPALGVDDWARCELCGGAGGEELSVPTMPSVSNILLRGAGDRGFAGGTIRTVCPQCSGTGFLFVRWEPKAAVR